MFRHTRIEPVLRQYLLALQESKSGSRDLQVQVSCHGADTAVAVAQFEMRWRINLEPDATAMTATDMDDSRGRHVFVQTSS